MKKLEYLKISFILRKDRIQEGLVPVYMKILLDGRKAYVSTGEKVNITQWDDKNGKFIGITPLVNSKNQRLDRMKNDVLSIYNKLKSM